MGRPPESTATLEDYQNLKPAQFKRESDLCDKIEKNIEYITEQLFEEKYIYHEREYVIPLGIMRGNLRADFCIHTNGGNYLCEVKNPTHDGELRNAIGQLLQYSILHPGFKLCLITTRYNDLLRQIIYKYSLPIKVFVFTKDKLLTLL